MRKEEGRGIYMHNVILGKPPVGFVTDHADRNGLNNQRSNLRFATKSQNGHNKRATGRSGIKGVYATRSKFKPWEAEIMHFGKTIRLGRFRTALEAKEAYNKKGLELYGSYFAP